MKNSLKVLFLVPYPIEGASVRYRIHQFLPYLDKANISYRVSSFMSKRLYGIVYKKGHFFKKIFYTLEGVLKRGFDFLSIPCYDLIFIHIETSPFPILLIERFAIFLKKKIIYDFDDAVFLKNPNVKRSVRFFLKSHSKTSGMISLSSKVLVCNSYLKDFSKQYLNEEDIFIFPTCIDIKRFDFPKISNSPPTIGWIGSHTTYPYLESLFDVFQTLSSHYSFILKVIGAPVQMNLSGVRLIQKKWNLYQEAKDFMSLDIGVYPMLDSSFARGKAAFKALQYMAAGVPCIASDVGMNKEVIQDGVNGFLVNTKEEWIKKISLLLTSQETREKIARAGKENVQKNYSLEMYAPKFIEILKGEKAISHKKL